MNKKSIKRVEQWNEDMDPQRRGRTMFINYATGIQSVCFGYGPAPAYILGSKGEIFSVRVDEDTRQGRPYRRGRSYLIVELDDDYRAELVAGFLYAKCARFRGDDGDGVIQLIDKLKAGAK